MQRSDLIVIGVLTLIAFLCFLFWRVLAVIMKTRLQTRVPHNEESAASAETDHEQDSKN